MCSRIAISYSDQLKGKCTIFTALSILPKINGDSLRNSRIFGFL